MREAASGRDPFEKVAEEFAERFRRGERPSLTEYVSKYPDLEAEIRELLPALVEMEEMRPVATAAPSPFGGGSKGQECVPQQLGEYRILREVARGGMGVVYEAVQESLGRHVALKVLPYQSLLNPHYLARFRRETRAAAGLHHSNIVPVFGVGEHEGVHYYAMQFIRGLGLDEVLAELKRMKHVEHAADAPGQSGHVENVLHGRGDVSAVELAQSLVTGISVKPLPEPAPTTPGEPIFTPAANALGSPLTEISPGRLSDTFSLSSSSMALPGAERTRNIKQTYCQSVAQIGVQVAGALAYAHQQGILHPDVKPSNLLLDTRGTVWLTDFGLAKADDSDELTKTGDVVGTLRYMAPERFQGQADYRSDVYSLGVTLYEMLTLRPAHQEPDRAHLIRQIMNQDPPRLRQVDGSIPRDLETVVLKAMDKEPARRYQSAEDLADDLGRFLADRPIQARRASAWERGWRWCRRNPLLAFSISTAAVLLVAVTIVSFFSAWRLARQLHQTQEAELLGKRRLYEARIAEAQARRWGGRVGQRFDSLRVLGEAAKIARDLELDEAKRLALRNEVIACTCLTDLRPLRELPCPGESPWLAFDADLARHAQADMQGTVTVRRVDDDRVLVELPGVSKPGQIGWVALSPDGRFLPVRHDGWPEVQVSIWDLNRREAVLRVPAGCACDFSPDSTRVAVSRYDGSVGLYNLVTGKEERRLTPGRAVTPPVGPFCYFNAQCSKLASYIMNDSRVCVWDLRSDSPARTLAFPDPVNALAWHPGGGLLAVGDCQMRIHLWDMEAERPHKVLEGHDLTVSGLAFNRGGDLLASTSWDGTTCLWDPRVGKALVRIPDANLAQFSADVASGGLEYVCLEVGTWEERWRRPSGFGGTLSGPIAFSPDGRVLAIASTPRDVALVDPATNRDYATLTAPTPPFLRHLCFSADGSQLVASNERSPAVPIWDLRRIREQLAEMDLDMDLPPYPPPTQSENAKPVQVTVDLGDLVAREKYSFILAVFPFHAEAYYQRGLAHARFQQWQQALADFNLAIVLQPNHAAAYCQRGRAYARIQQWHNVVADVTRSIELGSTDPGGWLDRAQAFSELGQWTAAMLDYSQAIERKATVPGPLLDEGQALNYYKLALLALACGDLERYRSTCARLLDTAEQGVSAEKTLWAAWTCVLAPQAVADATRIVALAERGFASRRNDFDGHLLLGAALCRAGRADQALKHLNQADACYPATASPQAGRLYPTLFLALAHQQLGQGREARDWLNKAVQAFDQASPETVKEVGAGAWNRRLTLQLLRKEAEALIGK